MNLFSFNICNIVRIAALNSLYANPNIQGAQDQYLLTLPFSLSMDHSLLFLCVWYNFA